MKYKAILSMLIGAILINCSPTNKTESIAEDAYIHKIKLTSLDGKTIEWTKYQGKKVILNIWATWCKPCIEEMPSLEVLQQKLPESEYALVLASSESAEKITAFADRNGYDLQFVQLKTPPESLGIYALPTTFIIDKKGQLLVTENGMRDWGEQKVVEEIMNL